MSTGGAGRGGLHALPAPPEGDPAAAAARRLRTSFGAWTTGVAIVACRDADGHPTGLTVNSFTSLSLSPPLLLWALALRSASLGAFRAAPHFGVSVLGAEHEALARRFAAPQRADRFAGVALRAPCAGAGGDAPLVDGALAWFACSTHDAREVGDHVLFVGRIERHGHRDGTPLVFHAGRFTALAAAPRTGG